MAKRAYLLHERAYQKMERDGVRSWSERLGQPAMGPELVRFLEDTLEQPWAPRVGTALELGCGTAPILRWIVRRGFAGVGVDVSPTAIRMARAQGRGSKLDLRVCDVTRLTSIADASIDLAIDGNCLHCLVEDADRRAFHREIARVLRPGSCFVLMSMAAPVLEGDFAKVNKRGWFDGELLFQPVAGARHARGAVRRGRRWYAPMRRFVPWRALLAALPRYGLTPRLVRVALCGEGEPLSHLCVAAERR